MRIVKDSIIFISVVESGGFSHAAKELQLSNGLVSRRISALESSLGVTLIKRTTRRLHLTSEGELFFAHAKRAQKEMNMAMDLIRNVSKNPRGTIRLSAPVYFGQNYLMPILYDFMNRFPDIVIDLTLSNSVYDLLKTQMDLVIRGSGYLDRKRLKDSSLRAKLLLKERIGCYASSKYLAKYGEPSSLIDLKQHKIIGYENDQFLLKNKITPFFVSNDIGCNLQSCISGLGIAKFTEKNAQEAVHKRQLRRILKDIDFGYYYLYALYSNQASLPQRTQMLLEFIKTSTCRGSASTCRGLSPSSTSRGPASM